MRTRPNLVYVFADQWRRSAMGCAPYADPVHTPHMDAFAASGVLCTDAISCCPLCSPHRAALLTGKYPFSTGVFTNCKPSLPIAIRDTERTIGDILLGAGYRTGYIGKWHLDVPEERTHRFPESGARRWDAYTPPGPGRHGFQEWLSYGAWDEHLKEHYWKDTPAQIHADKWSVEYETDRAIDFLARHENDREPMCLFLSWNPPHPPYDKLPEGLLEQVPQNIALRPNAVLTGVHNHTREAAPDGAYGSAADMRLTTRRYYAAVQGLDEQFGRLLAALQAYGYGEDTYVVLSADHGDMMGSHALIGKHVWYEESIGIPFVVAGPGVEPGRCGTVIGSPDIAPTLLGLLGIPVPDCMEGIDCAEDIRSHMAREDKMTFIGARPGLDCYLKEFAQAGLDPAAFGWRGVRTKKCTLVADAGYLPQKDNACGWLLYDLVHDPYALHPQVPDMTDGEAQRLGRLLARHLQKENDPFCTRLSKDLREE